MCRAAVRFARLGSHCRWARPNVLDVLALWHVLFSACLARDLGQCASAVSLGAHLFVLMLSKGGVGAQVRIGPVGNQEATYL